MPRNFNQLPQGTALSLLCPANFRAALTRHQVLLDGSKLAIGWTLHKRADRWTMIFIVNTNLLNEPLRTVINQVPDQIIDTKATSKINEFWTDIRAEVPAPKPAETAYGVVRGQELVEHVVHWLVRDPGNNRQPETVEWTYEIMLNGSGITPQPPNDYQREN